MAGNPPDPLRQPKFVVVSAFVGALLTVYLGLLVYDAIDPPYELPAALHALVAGTLGGYLGGTGFVVIKRGNGEVK